MTRVACIGECMIELREEADGRLSRRYGGDTLNTAIYLARLGIAVDYVTALGDDHWSDEMIAGWQDEGVGTDLVARRPGKLPGLYVIQNDAKGERRFSYWRDSAPARTLFDGPPAAELVEALANYDLVYFSGITLSLYDGPARERLNEAARLTRARGHRVAFDSNYRRRGWPDGGAAQEAFKRAFASADIVLASSDDLNLLFGAGGEAELLAHARLAETVLKRAEPACRVLAPGLDIVVHAAPVAGVVDTTAAGDSFAAAYLAARLNGADPAAAANAGHLLAGVVVQHPGAIIPRAAMPPLVNLSTTRPT